MKKIEPLFLHISKEFLETAPMPRVTVEQAKLILVYQALRDNNWHRAKAAFDIKMPERTFRYYVGLLMQYGFVESKVTSSI